MGIFPSTVSHTAIYLLHMYQQTGNSSYLQIVKETAAWLIGGTENGYALRHQENGGYKWLGDIPYFVGRSPTTDFPLYETAWVALFFLETHSVLGNETYLENAKGAIRWLLSKTVDDCKWPNLAGETEYYLLPWQRWGHCLIDLLISAYTITGDTTYLDYAKRHTNWMINQAVAEGDGYKFPEYEGGTTYDLYTNAQAHAYLLMMYEQTSNLTYLTYADGVKNWLLNNAVAGNPGYKWKTQATSPYYNPCWWGSSGIGYYLLEDTVEVIPEFPSSALLLFIAWTFLVAAIAARISKKLKIHSYCHG
jgi:uncharacterized protein YyaL (SSP411 family)